MELNPSSSNSSSFSFEWLTSNVSIYGIVNIKAFTYNMFVFSKLFHADGRLSVFALKASELRLICSMWSDGRKDIQCAKLARWNLHSELNACILPSLEGNSKGCNMNSHNSSNLHNWWVCKVNSKTWFTNFCFVSDVKTLVFCLGALSYVSVTKLVKICPKFT